MAREGCRIAVIGAGFSGVMTAIHLLWRCNPGERVYLVERGDRVGPGLAYGTHNPRHLVNVRAENMSAFADEPDHFIRWLDGLEPEPARRGGRAHHRRHLRAPLGVRRLCPGAAARGDRAPGRCGQSLPGHRRGHRRPPRQWRSPARDRQWPRLPDRRRRSGPGQRGRAEGRAPGLCRRSLVGRRDRTVGAGPAGGRARHRADHGRCLPGAHRAGLQGSDPRHLPPRPAAAGPCTFQALGASLRSRRTIAARCCRCSVRSAARCGAPGRVRSAGAR